MAKISDIPFKTRTSKVPAGGYAVWGVHEDGVGGTYLEATYTLPEGIATIYIQGGEKISPHTRIQFTRIQFTRIQFTRNGCAYCRDWHHRFTRPTAQRLARQFVAEILQANP